MNPEFEKKVLKEYLEISENPMGKSNSYRKIKISSYVVAILSFSLVWIDYEYCVFSDLIQLFLAGSSGVFLTLAGMIGHSQVQGPLISSYIQSDKIKERLDELDA